MNKDEIEFFHILRDYLWGKIDHYSVSDQILYYAKIHGIEGIIYKQTKVQSIQSEFASVVYYYNCRRRIVKEICEKLSGIPFFFIKGMEIAKYYPDPYLRTMGDVDIIVKPDNLKQVKDVFSGCGFSVKLTSENVYCASKGAIQFEIHTSLVHSGICSDRSRLFFEDCWDYVHDNKLDKNYHFVFTIQHLQGHMVSEGVGFRQFMDVALFSRDEELNWDWIIRGLDKIGLLEFTKKVFAFIKRWFEYDSPFLIEKLDEEFYQEASRKILYGGVFGHDDKTNKDVGIVKQAIDDGCNLRKAKGRYLIKELFPSYTRMCTLPYCSYVKKSVLLLPVAWFHRIAKRGLNYSYRYNYLIRYRTNEIAQERLELLRKWGL